MALLGLELHTLTSGPLSPPSLLVRSAGQKHQHTPPAVSVESGGGGGTGVEEPRALAAVLRTVSAQAKPKAEPPPARHWVCLETELTFLQLCRQCTEHIPRLLSL